MEQSESFIRRRERLGLALIGGFFALPILIFVAFLWWTITRVQTLRGPHEITIEPQTGFIEISNALAKEGIIRQVSSFRIYVLFRSWAGALKSGRYTFQGEVSLPDVARTLVSGPADVEVTIPEGFSVTDIDKRLSSIGLTAPGKIMELAHKPDLFHYPFLEHGSMFTLEGFLFPDTYRFNYSMTAEDMVQKILDNFGQKMWSNYSQAFIGSKHSFYDTLTMASLLEEETARSGDRRIISGILWRRLDAHIPLQVDATVIYAWKQLSPDWKPKNHALDGAEIKINSPYNTYRVQGLPPGPIANPGLDAFLAALQPQASPYWYYLSAKDGRTIFSSTLAQQNAARAKYLSP